MIEEKRGSGFTRALVRFGHRRPYHVLVGAVVVIAAGVFFGTRLDFDTDVMSLVPRHDPVIDEFRRTFERFGSLDTLVVAVKVPISPVSVTVTSGTPLVSGEES